MGVIREEDAVDNVMKKSKKRKKRESSALGEEEDFVRLGDEGHKKKIKTEVLGDREACEEVCDVDFTMDVDNRTKKKKKVKVRKDSKDQGNDNTRERGKKKCEIGDEGWALDAVKAPKEKIYAESQDRGFSELQLQTRKKEQIHVEEIKKIDGNDIRLKEKNSVMESNDFEKEKQAKQQGQVKKNKNKKKTMGELKRKEADYADENDSVAHVGFLENQIDNVLIEKVECIEKKKKPKKKKRKEDENQVDKKKKTKNKKRKEEENLGACYSDKGHLNKSHEYSISSREDSGSGGSERKEKSIGSNAGDPNGIAYENNNRNDAIKPFEKSSLDKKLKKVRFSDHVEVFSPPDDSSGEEENLKDDLIQGKRFSREEDEIVKNAVLKYVEDHKLGEDGLEMVLKCKLYPKVKGCWKKIGKALPWRPYRGVYFRAHKLFERSESRKWTPEELELVKKNHEERGSSWKSLADQLGKHHSHVERAWNRIKLPNRKLGKWSQEEYQTLFDLVNVDLSMKAFGEKKSRHGMLRDNIGWEAISEKLSTRTNPKCCQKWYNQLTSSMVAEGKWADTDDYRLLMALVELDAPCEEDVDWDNLIEHRSGDVCRKRWNQMVRHIGEHGTKSFGEQVDILSQRYRLDLLEAREAYDSKSPVD